MQQAELPGAEAISRVFEEVLAGPDFGRPRSSLLGRILRSLGRWLNDLLGGWLPTLDDAQVRLLSWLLVGAFAVAVVFVAWRKTSGLEPRPGRRLAKDAEPGPRSARDWARWARDEQGSGRLRGAATGLYQAVVLHLETRGMLRYGEWKTPGDYAEEVAGGDAAPPFESFLALFVEVAFGPADPSPESVDALFARAERLGCPT